MICSLHVRQVKKSKLVCLEGSIFYTKEQTCEVAPIEDRYEDHHKKAAAKIGTDNFTNIETLCLSCQNKIDILTLIYTFKKCARFKVDIVSYILIYF